jgi:hypothetical protein
MNLGCDFHEVPAAVGERPRTATTGRCDIGDPRGFADVSQPVSAAQPARDAPVSLASAGH